MSITLRPYQSDAIDKIRSLMQKGCKTILYQGVTGSGKTALTAHMLHTAASKGMRSLFIVHRRELIKQSARAFDQEGIKYGIISAGFIEERRHLVQLASVQTLARRIHRYPEPSLVVWDECHHLAAGSWEKIYRALPCAYHVGITATPTRLDGRGLSVFFREMIQGPSVSELMAAGYLSHYKLYAPSTVSMDGIHTRMGDYEKNELSRAMDRPSITGNAIEHYRRLCMGRRAVVFCCSIQHSKNVVQEFISVGIRAAHVDGETPGDERDASIEEFKMGSIKVLSNVDLFGEGFDVPSIEAAILLRPTQSLGLYLQQVGRSLRPYPGKDRATILDHVGNWSRHGLPDDTRQWSLQGIPRRDERSRDAGISVKICPKCFAAQEAGRPSCKFCGFVYPIEARKIEEREGELQEIKAEIARKQARRDQGMAQSMQELYEIGKSRGMKNPRAWAYYVYKARQAKRNRGATA